LRAEAYYSRDGKKEKRERIKMEKRKEMRVIAHFQSTETYRKLYRFRPHDRQIILEKGVEYILRNLTGDEIDAMLEENKIPYVTGRPKGVVNKVRDVKESDRETSGRYGRTEASSTEASAVSRVKGIAVRSAIPPEETVGKKNGDDLGLSNLK
jgi:hypothetical protein